MNRIQLLILVLLWSGCHSDSGIRYTILDNGNLLTSLDSMEYVWIPKGETSINKKTEVDGQTRMQPTDVNFSRGFWMSKTEITIKQFRKFANATNYITEAENNKNKFNLQQPGFEQQADHPVVYVSVNDAIAYLNWAGSELPTQEEWIYALKAGSSNKYYWGNEFDDRYVWYRMNASSGTRPAGTRLPNAWGLHDMIGNVYEYVTVCDSSQRTIGASWTRCDNYHSHIPGDTVNLGIGQLDKFTLEKCAAQLINPYNDDTGIRCVIRHIDQEGDLIP